jgi:hypothetical protein
VAQRYYKKQKIIYLSNNISEHFDVWSRSMANSYQRNKQNFIYRNGCAKEISKKIKDGKNKKLTYKRHTGSEREAGHYRHHREKRLQ